MSVSLAPSMLRVACVAATGSVRAGFAPMGARSMSMEGMRTYGDRERGEERVYFTKEDERLLRKLLGKMKKQADVSDKHEAVGTHAAEVSALKDIVGKYELSEDDLVKLVAWKHDH